jgi:hypothetical protein
VFDGNYLAVGSQLGDGSDDDTDDTGEVYIYSFTHLAGDEFANGTLEGSIGFDYTGGTAQGTRDINVAYCLRL